MKKLLTFGAIALAALAIAGCQKETAPDLVNPDNGDKVIIKATREGGTKTVIADDGKTILWEKGDALSIFHGPGDKGGSEFSTVADAEYPAAVASFEGTLPIVAGPEIDLPFYGIYPYSVDNAVNEDGSLSIDIKTQQSPVAGSFDPDAFPAVAVSDNLNLPFYNVCGLLALNIDIEGAYLVELEAADGQPLSGPATVTFEDGRPVLEFGDLAHGIVQLLGVEIGEAGPEIVPFDRDETYYLAVPPTTFKGLSFSIYTINADDPIVISTDAALTVERSKVHEVSTFTAPEVEAEVIIYDIDDPLLEPFLGDVNSVGLFQYNSFAWVIGGQDIESGEYGIFPTYYITDWQYEPADLLDYYSKDLSEDEVNAINNGGCLGYEAYTAEGKLIEAATSYTMVVKLTNIYGTTAVLTDEYTTAPVVVDAPYLWDFENDSYGWIFVDADGDGYNWRRNNGTSYSGDYCLMSASYVDYVGAVNPDNWAITPAIRLTENNYLNFQIGAQNASYSAENYEVHIAVADPDNLINAATWDTVDWGDPILGETLASADYHLVSYSLAEYANELVYIAIRHFDCTDMYYLNLDDFQITEGELEVVPVIATLSVYDMDDEAAIAGYYTDNSFYYGIEGEDIVSATVGVWQTLYLDSFGYSGNELLGYASFELDEDALAVINGKGYYDLVAVETYGPAVLQPNTSYTVIAKLTNSAGTPEVFTAEYVTAAEPEIIEDVPCYWYFESRPRGWSYIDADGDGNNWYSSYSTAIKSHSGYGVLSSASYASKALTPDNYAITPAINFTEGNYLSFWAIAQDNSWPSEHYAVYITAELPDADIDPEGMTVLLEETELTATPANHVIAIPDAFANSTGYIVFRHFNCTDWFRINIDDVSVTAGLPAEKAPKAILRSNHKKATKKANKFERPGKTNDLLKKFETIADHR